MKKGKGKKYKLYNSKKPRKHGGRSSGTGRHSEFGRHTNGARTSNSKGNGRTARRVEDELPNVVVGTYQIGRVGRRTGEAAYGFVIPDSKRVRGDIFVSRERSKGAKDGEKVVVRITEHGDNGKKPRYQTRGRHAAPRKSEGIITEILGAMDAPGVDITSIVRSYDLPDRFPREVLREASEVAVPVDESRLDGRLDLRDTVTITIDGDDSKDFDDAVSLCRDGDGWKLGVHIADVCEYVKEGSPLDKEALKRGTSVYLPDRVIPMLPEVLSNGICSLNPGEDRLVLSCLMTLDDDGNVKDSRIVEGVIRSRHRMTYGNVQKILDGDAELREEYADIAGMLDDMDTMARRIRGRRSTQGALDFDLPEAEIELDGEGRTVDVRVHERNRATDLIEDFMLLANETVARTFAEMGTPFIYRIHEDPEPDRIRDLAALVARLGYHMKLGKGGNALPKELQGLLHEVEGTEAERLIRTLTLRAMSQAKYSTRCSGHFGLAMEYYTHFTSPIRRYPDLQIHRIIKEHLSGRLDDGRMSHYEGILDEVAGRSSTLERRAVEVERDADKVKMVEYMQDHLGDEYDGVISGVTEWGIYVELPNCIEGMVPLRDMTDDYYQLDEGGYQVIGRLSGRRYGLGEAVRVQVARADKLAGEIDFILLDKASDISLGR